MSSDIGSGLTSVIVKVDGTVISSSGISSWTADFGPLLAGAHTIEVLAIDNSGNVGNDSTTVHLTATQATSDLIAQISAEPLQKTVNCSLLAPMKEVQKS